MQKIISIFYLIFFLLVLFCGMSFSQVIDLSGTWKGTAEMPEDPPEMAEITMVLHKDEGKYKGTISDSFGIVAEEELKDLKFEKNELTGYFIVYDGYAEIKVLFSLKVEGEKMSGVCTLEDGSIEVPVKLERVKEK